MLQTRSLLLFARGTPTGERGHRRGILRFPRRDSTMQTRNRREFLADVGRGMLIASVGPALACDLGLSPLHAAEGPDTLSFGKLEPPVALANARTFGGQDYVGFHTLMALAPAYEMARELPEAERPLPILKVLHRN